MKKPQIPVAILVRVSTAKQETARQISELRQYADGKDYKVLEVCEETVSGSAGDDERHGLHRAAQLARDGHIKKVLVHEISRIARRNSVAHRFVETLEDCNVSLYWHAQAVETLLPSGKRNPAAGNHACAARGDGAERNGDPSRSNQIWPSSCTETRSSVGPTKRNDARKSAILAEAQGHPPAVEGWAIGSQCSPNRG